MAVYDVYVPYNGEAHIEVEADSEAQAIANVQAGGGILSDVIPDYAQVLWDDAYAEER